MTNNDKKDYPLRVTHISIDPAYYNTGVTIQLSDKSYRFILITTQSKKYSSYIKEQDSIIEVNDRIEYYKNHVRIGYLFDFNFIRNHIIPTILLHNIENKGKKKLKSSSSSSKWTKQSPITYFKKNCTSGVKGALIGACILANIPYILKGCYNIHTPPQQEQESEYFIPAPNPLYSQVVNIAIEDKAYGSFRIADFSELIGSIQSIIVGDLAYQLIYTNVIPVPISYVKKSILSKGKADKIDSINLFKEYNNNMDPITSDVADSFCIHLAAQKIKSSICDNRKITIKEREV